MKRIVTAVVILLIVNLSAPRAMVISGTVKDSASGTALSNIYVSLRTAAKALVRDTTDATGAYSITYDSSGAFTLRATDLGNLYTQSNREVTIDSAIDQTVDIAMVKPPTATVSGTITDSAGGTTIGGAIVSLKAGNAASLKDTADTGGVYSISVPYAAYKITATARGYSPKSDSVTVADTTAQTKNFQLVAQALSSITGTVTDSASGAVLTGAKVVLSSGSGMTKSKIDSAITTAEGTFAIDSVPPGSYSIAVSCAAYNQKSDTLTIPDTAAKTVTISLVKTIYGAISGTVTDSSSAAAVADAKVMLYRGSGTTRSRLDSAVTAAEGTYSFDSIPAGSYTITVTCATYDQKSDSATVSDTTVKTVNIALVKTAYGTITGNITDSTAGTALSEAKVMVYRGTMRTVVDSAVTAAEGTYSFDSLAVGTYSITVSRDGYLTKTDSMAITDTATKTLNIALNKKVYCTITGIVTDSATGALLAGIPVVLRWNGADGTRLAIDSTVTDSTGAYSLDSAFTGTYVRSSPAGYTRKAIDLTVSSDSTQKVDLALAAATMAVRFQRGGGTCGIPSIIAMPGGNLRLINGSSVTAIALYYLNGRMLWKRTMNSDVPASTLSIGKPVSCGKYIVQLYRKGSSIRQMIFIP